MQKHVTTMLLQYTTMVLVQRMMSVVFVAVTVSLMVHVIVTATYLTPLAYVVATVLLTLTLTEYVTM